jgi:Na+-driven multidrug efflux pump
VRRHGASWRPQPAAIRGQLVVGRDLVVRTVVLLGVFSAAQAGAARVGVDELAAYAIAFQLWMIGAYAVDGIEAAGQSLIAHRIGAGRTDEVRAVVGRLVRWALTLGCSVGAILAATSALSPHLFTNDTNVVAAASASLLWVAAMQPVGSLAFALDGVLVGAGRQRYLAGAMVAAGAAFALTTVAVGRRDLAAIWVAVTTFMVVRALTGVWGVRRLTPT